MNTTITDTEDYTANLLVDGHCSDEFMPVDFLKLSISPSEARNILKIQELHSRQRSEADAVLGIANAILETWADFHIECYDYTEDYFEQPNGPETVWDDGKLDDEDAVAISYGKLRFDGDRISLRAQPKHMQGCINTCSITAEIRDIAEGRTPSEARVS